MGAKGPRIQIVGSPGIAERDGICFRGTLEAGRRTGRSLPEVLAQAGVAGRGKSELQRAVCRITSGP